MLKWWRKLYFGVVLAAIPMVAYADVATIAAYVAQAIGSYLAVAAVIAIQVYGSVQERRRMRRDAARQRAAYNASLIDRNVTLLRDLPPQRTSYGRALTGGDIVDILSSDKQGIREDGSAYTRPDGLKHLVIQFATHEVENIHEIYIDGIGVGAVDSNGWATGGAFGRVRRVSRTAIFTGSTTIPHPAVSIVGAGYIAADVGGVSVSVAISGGGLTLTDTSGSGQNITCTYLVDDPLSSVRWSKHLGSPTQTVDTYLNGILPDAQTAAHRLRGIAYVVVTLDLEDQRFQGGPPQIIADVSGKSVLDTRTGTTAWTANPALCIRDFLVSEMGYEAADTDINMAYCNAAASACDVSTNFTVNGVTTTGPRYALHGSFNSDESKEKVLEDLCESMAGFAIYGAQWMIIAGAWTVPVTFPDGTDVLSDNDLHGQIEIVQSGASQDDLFNGVRGTFIEATVRRGTGTGYLAAAASAGATSLSLSAGSGTILKGNGVLLGDDQNVYIVAADLAGPGVVQLEEPGLLLPVTVGTATSVISVAESSPKDLQPYQNATFLAADGEPLWSDIELRFTANAARARNLQRIQTEKNRSSQVIRFPAKLKAWPLQVGDRVKVTSAEYGFVAKTYRCTDWEFGAQTAVILTLQEDAAEIYDEADAAVSDPTPNTTLQSPWSPPILTGLTASSGTGQLLVNSDGTIVSRVLVEWDAITGPYIADGGRVVVRWRNSDGVWLQTTALGTETAAYLSPMKDLDFVVIEAYVVNNATARGPSAYIFHMVQGKTALPANATGLRATPVTNGIRLDVDSNSEPDVQNRTEFRVGSSWATAGTIFKGASNTYTWPSPPRGTHTVLAKHFDTTGNESAAAASLSAVVDGSSAVDPFAASLVWDFNGTTNGWIAVAQVMLTANQNSLTFTSTGVDPGIRSPAISLNGALYDKVRARVKRVAGAGWDGTVFFSNVGHSDSASFRKNISDSTVTGQWGVLEWDMAALTVGDADWISNTTTNIRLDLGSTASDVFEIDWIAIGRYVVGDLNATSDLSLTARGNCIVTGNNARKSGGAAAWDSDVYSRDSYTGGAYASAVPSQSGADIMFGLNADPLTDGSYASIDWAMYAEANGNFHAFASGSLLASIGTYVATDVLAVLYDGVRIYWLKNGVILHTVIVAAALRFFYDSSFYTPGGALSNIRFGPLSAVTNIGTGQIQANAATDVVLGTLVPGPVGFSTVS
jgi:hypothetical protein